MSSKIYGLYENTVLNIYIIYSKVRLSGEINISLKWKGFPTPVTSALSMPNSRKPDGFEYYVFSWRKSTFSHPPSKSWLFQPNAIRKKNHTMVSNVCFSLPLPNPLHLNRKEKISSVTKKMSFFSSSSLQLKSSALRSAVRFLFWRLPQSRLLKMTSETGSAVLNRETQSKDKPELGIHQQATFH